MLFELTGSNEHVYFGGWRQWTNALSIDVYIAFLFHVCNRRWDAALWDRNRRWKKNDVNASCILNDWRKFTSFGITNITQLMSMKYCMLHIFTSHSKALQWILKMFWRNQVFNQVQNMSKPKTMTHKSSLFRCYFYSMKRFFWNNCYFYVLLLEMLYYFNIKVFLNPKNSGISKIY